MCSSIMVCWWKYFSLITYLHQWSSLTFNNQKGLAPMARLVRKGSWIPSPPCCLGALMVFQFTRWIFLLSYFPPSQINSLIYMPSWCKTYLGAWRAENWYKGMVDNIDFTKTVLPALFNQIPPQLTILVLIFSRNLFQEHGAAHLRKIGTLR